MGTIQILYRNRMFKLLTRDWKKAAQKLSTIGMGKNAHEHITTFKDISMLVATDVIKGTHIDQYIKAMRAATLTPDLLLKFCIFIHVYIHEQNPIDEDKLIHFLSYLLERSAEMIESFAKMEEKADVSSRSKSVCSRPVSTRSEEAVICKQVFLLSAVVRPYLGYLMKIVSMFMTYGQWTRKRGSFERHEAWMMINLLKMITSVTNNFTMIGRYYIRSYGYLVVVLTKALSRDIRLYVQATGKFVTAQNCLLTCSTSINPQNKCDLEEFIKMLEEITKLNDQLLSVYLGKYFFDHIRDIPEPKWINTNSTQFDTIFKLKQALNSSFTNSTSTNQISPSFKTKKRTMSTYKQRGSIILSVN